MEQDQIKQVAAAVSGACHLPEELVTQYVKQLGPVQFEQLVGATASRKNEEQRVAMIRLAVALTLAQEAVLLAHAAMGDVGRMPENFSVEGLTLDRIDQALALAIQIKLSTDLARDTLKQLSDAVAADLPPATSSATNEPPTDTSQSDVKTEPTASQPSTDSPPQAASEPPAAEPGSGSPATEPPTSTAPAQEPAPPSDPVATTPSSEPDQAPATPPAEPPQTDPAPAPPTSGPKKPRGGLGSRI